MMNEGNRQKMFKDVFAPKKGEKVLFLYDIPKDDKSDNFNWAQRREYIGVWHHAFQETGGKEGFSVDIQKYPATGMHNSPIPNQVIDLAKDYNLVIAMTEYSATASLNPLCKLKNSKLRVASMPLVNPGMEDTAFLADYSKVKTYAENLRKLLNEAVGAEILFSTNHELYVDLRNRIAESDDGDCRNPGTLINFPSGEAFKAPYEAVAGELDQFGKSKTEGIMPVHKNSQVILFQIKNNQIVYIVGNSKEAQEFRDFFEENPSRRNIAEFGVGCNPRAVVSGSVLEDEKVGLHIAYGKSSHLGGKVDSDVHQDIVFAKGCPLEGRIVNLIKAEGSRLEIIRDAQLRYDLIER